MRSLFRRLTTTRVPLFKRSIVIQVTRRGNKKKNPEISPAKPNRSYRFLTSVDSVSQHGACTRALLSNSRIRWSIIWISGRWLWDAAQVVLLWILQSHYFYCEMLIQELQCHLDPCSAVNKLLMLSYKPDQSSPEQKDGCECTWQTVCDGIDWT